MKSAYVFALLLVLSVAPARAQLNGDPFGGGGTGGGGGGGGGVSGSGTAGQVVKFATATSVADSVITESVGKIGISTTSPNLKLDVRGDSVLYSVSSSYAEGMNVFRTGAGSFGEGFNLHEGAAGTAPSASTLGAYVRLLAAAGHDDMLLGTYDGTADHRAMFVQNSTRNVVFGENLIGDIESATNPGTIIYPQGELFVVADATGPNVGTSIFIDIVSGNTVTIGQGTIQAGAAGSAISAINGDVEAQHFIATTNGSNSTVNFYVSGAADTGIALPGTGEVRVVSGGALNLSVAANTITIPTASDVVVEQTIATALTTNTNNYNPGKGSNLRLSATSAVNVTGMVAVSGKVIVIRVTGSNAVTFQHENASSTAVNRFTNRNALDVTVSPGETIVYAYDGSPTSRWVEVGRDIRGTQKVETFSGVAPANYPVGTAFAHHDFQVAFTEESLRSTILVAGTSTIGTETVIAVVEDSGGTNICTLTIDCDDAAGTLDTGICGGTDSAGLYRMVLESSTCTTNPSINLNFSSSYF